MFSPSGRLTLPAQAHNALEMPSATYSIFFVVGVLFSVGSWAVFLFSLAGLAIRKRRRPLAQAVGVIAWLVVGTALLAGFAYFSEFLFAWFSGNVYEQAAFSYRVFGRYAWAYWLDAFCHVIIPQLFWIRYCRANLLAALLISVMSAVPGVVEKIMVAFFLSVN